MTGINWSNDGFKTIEFGGSEELEFGADGVKMPRRRGNSQDSHGIDAVNIVPHTHSSGVTAPGQDSTLLGRV